jgi:hypothetical protein
MKRALLMTIVLLLATACTSTTGNRGAPAASVTLTTDRESYAPGDTVSVTLTNNSDGDVGYNLCLRVLEHRTSQAWEEVGYFPQLPDVCIMPLALLRAGKQILVTAVIPGSATAGRYRFDFRGAPPEAQTTNEFTVAPR